MKLIRKKQQKQERKKFLNAYREYIVEYKDKSGDIQRMLLVRDDLFKRVIVFLPSSVYTYCISNDLSLEEIYEQVVKDSEIDILIGIYSISTAVSCKDIKEVS